MDITKKDKEIVENLKEPLNPKQKQKTTKLSILLNLLGFLLSIQL